MSYFKKELKEKLNKELNAIEIKTDSQSILNGYHFEAKEKNHFYKKLSFKIAVPLISAFAVSVLIVTPILLKDGSQNNPLSNNQLNNVCYEIFAGVSYISSSHNSTQQIQKAHKVKDENNFIDMSDFFYTYYGLLNEVNSYNDNNEKFVSIKSDDKNYPFCVLVNNQFKIYYQNETKVENEKVRKGYILNNDEKYSLEIKEEHEKDINEEEYEKTVTIYYSNIDYIEIEKEYEIENEEKEFSYSIKEIKNNNRFNIISFELENNTKELEIEYHKGKLIEYEYEYEYISIDNLSINYDGIETFNGVNYNISTNLFTYDSYSHIGNKK